MSRAAVIGCVLLALLVLPGQPAVAQTGVATEQIVPDEPVGGYPTSRYEIWYSPGGTFDFGSKALGLLTELLFGAVRVLVSVATWLITWAYSFRFASGLAEPAGRLAEAYQSRLIGPIGLSSLALFAAVVYAGWNVLRSRLARGVGELLVSLLVLGVGGVLLASPASTFRTGVGVAASLSGVVLELANAHGSTGSVPAPDEAAADYAVGTDAIEPLTDGLRQAFIAQPHDLLNWGSVLSGQCAAQRDQILAEGPHGSDDRPRELMAAGGGACEPLVAWNERPTVERFMGAGLVLLAALVVLVAMVLVAVTVVIAQLVAVVLVGVMPLAIVGGVLPGGGRQLLWRWAAAGLQCIVAVVAMAALLSFMLITSDALLSDAEHSLLERFGLLVVMTVAMVLLRRKVLRGAQSMVRNLDRRLESARVGGAHGAGWMRPAAAGGVSGFGVAQLAEDGHGDVRDLRRHAHLRGLPASALVRPRLSAHPATGGSAVPPDAPTGAGHAGGRPFGDRTRLGRAGQAVAAATGHTVKTATNLSINLPRSAPRAAALAQVATSDATRALQTRLRSGHQQAHTAAREWRDGIAHPVGSVRRERDRILAERGRQRGRASADAQLRSVVRSAGPQEDR
ncbi:MAG: type IV secretion system protein [Egibacteraceae bacterium]